MHNYLVIYEKNPQGHFSAYVPDLPGCTSFGITLDEVKSNMKEAIEIYIDEMKADGKDIPRPTTIGEICEIDIP